MSEEIVGPVPVPVPEEHDGEPAPVTEEIQVETPSGEPVAEELPPAEEQTPAGEAPVEEPAEVHEESFVAEVVDAGELVADDTAAGETDRAEVKAVIEAVIYITDEPLNAQQIASALDRPLELVKELLAELCEEYARPERGLTIREIAGGYKLATKPEHHEAVRTFVKNLKPPLKLSLAALETLAVIAYKQPVTGPEIMEIRGVQGLGVLKTLMDRKLIATAGRKNVVGKPILYKTTKDFLVQFGLKDLAELPTLKEFEELGRLAMSDGENEPVAAPETAAETPQPETEAELPAEVPAEPAIDAPAAEAATAPEAAPETEPAPETPEPEPVADSAAESPEPQPENPTTEENA